MGITIYCLGKKAYYSFSTLRKELIEYIDCVVVGRDKNVINDYASEIIDWAKIHNIKTIERSDFNLDYNNSLYHIALGWRWLNIVKEHQKLIVIHDSLLPKYRGFNPLVTSLINGDTEIGATAILGSMEFDTGDILSQKSIKISYPIKISSAIDKICLIYAEILQDIIIQIKNNIPLDGIPQDESRATYSLWRDKDDYFIDWNNNSSEIKRMIDALGYPYEGARSYLEENIVIIEDAEEINDIHIINRKPGKVIFKKDDKVCVVCGKGIIKLITCKAINGKEIDFKGKLRLRFRTCSD